MLRSAWQGSSAVDGSGSPVIGDVVFLESHSSMYARSYALPSAASTGSTMISCEIGQSSSSGISPPENPPYSAGTRTSWRPPEARLLPLPPLLPPPLLPLPPPPPLPPPLLLPPLPPAAPVLATQADEASGATERGLLGWGRPNECEASEAEGAVKSQAAENVLEAELGDTGCEATAELFTPA